MKSRLATPPRPATPDEVLAACRNLNLLCPQDISERLCVYLNMLQKWNARMNLVGERHWHAILSKLAADSWPLAEFIETLPLPDEPHCLDLGAGAGLPGVPLRLLWSKGRYTMVELRAKRAMFLQQVLAHVALPGVDIFEGRAEQAMAALPAEHKADLILSRAFMPWRELVLLVHQHLAQGGILLVLANEPPPEELPPPWRLAASRAYEVDDKSRHFWALAAEA